MSGSKSRRKGAAFERRCAADLRAVGYDAKRNLEEVRSGNCGDLVTDSPCTYQLKCYEKQVPWRRAYREAVDASTNGRIPVAVTKANNDAPFVHLTWSDWLELVGKLRSEGVW